MAGDVGEGIGDRVRRQQAEGRTMTAREAADALLAMIQPHADHPWRRIGRCVYCGPCRVRLYQGDMPPDHEVYKPPYQPTEADRMRDRWNKT